MTEQEWNVFTEFRTDFKHQCKQWLQECGYTYSAPYEPVCSVEKLLQSRQDTIQVTGEKNAAGSIPNGTASRGAIVPSLHILQQEAAEADGTPFYPVETPFVYNHSLDEVRREDTIKLIIISDNPGKNEQLHCNQRYLVGQAGKVADNFFKRHPELGIDFRRETIILNKTPLHTAKTKQIGVILKKAGGDFAVLLAETQRRLARSTAVLQKKLGCPLWLVGYGELRKKALFTVYAEELKKQYTEDVLDMNKIPIFVFQHFSMNCFSNDLKKRFDHSKTLKENIAAIGLAHRKEILGW
ncbi:MAG: hypothetical protein ACTTH7_02295 [Treponema sp.]